MLNKIVEFVCLFVFFFWLIYWLYIYITIILLLLLISAESRGLLEQLMRLMGFLSNPICG
jgi:hypothetical protein